MRIFIAYSIDEQTKKTISEIQEQLRPIYQNGRFKQPQNMHMTLKFVGEVTVDQFDRLVFEINQIMKEYSSLTVDLDQLGFFGNTTKKHTVWIGCQPHSSMINLSSALTQCAITAGISVSDTPFVPHITLAQHGILLDDLPKVDSIQVRFDQVCIFLSSRIEGELIYQPLTCWKLT
jgi:2'-5' RNA ligase